MKNNLDIERGMNRWKCEEKEDTGFGRGGGGAASSSRSRSYYKNEETNPARSMENSLMWLSLVPIASFALTGLLFFGGIVYTTEKEQSRVKNMARELIKKESLGIPFFPELSRDEIIMINYGKGLAFRIADKNQNYVLEDKELYQLGRGLEVITNKEKISKESLVKRIRDAPEEKYDNYLKNYFNN